MGDIKNVEEIYDILQKQNLLNKDMLGVIVSLINDISIWSNKVCKKIEQLEEEIKELKSMKGE